MKTIEQQLTELKEPVPAWVCEGGVSLDSARVDWLSTQFKENYPPDISTPLFYHSFCIGGGTGIRAEWVNGEFDFSLDIDLTLEVGYWNSLHFETKISEDRDIDLNNRDDWGWVVQQIREKFK